MFSCCFGLSIEGGVPKSPPKLIHTTNCQKQEIIAVFCVVFSSFSSMFPCFCCVFAVFAPSRLRATLQAVAVNLRQNRLELSHFSRFCRVSGCFQSFSLVSVQIRSFPPSSASRLRVSYRYNLIFLPSKFTLQTSPFLYQFVKGLDPFLPQAIKIRHVFQHGPQSV